MSLRLWPSSNRSNRNPEKLSTMNEAAKPIRQPSPGGWEPALRYVYLTHVWSLNHHGHDPLVPVEHVCQFPLHFEADSGDRIYIERIASYDVDHLVFLVPADDAWILRGVERQIRLVGSGPDHHSTL